MNKTWSNIDLKECDVLKFVRNIPTCEDSKV